LKKISIIIPVNNENENILLIADALQKASNRLLPWDKVRDVREAFNSK